MGHVIVGWITGVGVIGLYAGRLVWRGRRLGALVPAGRRRWMTADD